MPADPKLTELIKAMNEYVDGDKDRAAELVKVMRTDVKDVAQKLINVGAGQKAGEAKDKLDEAQKRIGELTAQVEQHDTEMAELRAKTPDAAQIEEKARVRWERQVKKADEAREAAERRFNDAIQQVGVDKAVALLITPNEQGVRVHPDYAKLIAAQKLRPYIVPKSDGSFSVRQIGEQEAEYDGDTLDTRIAALVKDFRSEIPADFQLSNADGGAGVRNGGGGSVTGPKKSLDQIIAQKFNDPAFAGM